METTYDPKHSIHNGDDQSSRYALKNSARKAQSAGAQEVQNLIADVEELFNRIGQAADPEVARLRKKIEETISATKKALADGADQVQQKTRDAIDAGQRYVSEQPWQAIGIAAVVGLAAGFLVSRR